MSIIYRLDFDNPLPKFNSPSVIGFCEDKAEVSRVLMKCNIPNARDYTGGLTLFIYTPEEKLSRSEFGIIHHVLKQSIKDNKDIILYCPEDSLAATVLKAARAYRCNTVQSYDSPNIPLLTNMLDCFDEFNLLFDEPEEYTHEHTGA